MGRGMGRGMARGKTTKINGSKATTKAGSARNGAGKGMKAGAAAQAGLKAKSGAKTGAATGAKTRAAAGAKTRAAAGAKTRAATGAAAGANGYRPSESEPFMNPRMREYFRRKLLDWKAELVEESNETIHHLQQGSSSEPDLADRASLETDRSLELRTRDRERKLIAKIDQAIERIDEGSYGYCEETEEPIALRRLEARPIATLSLEAQERHERMERTHRDD